MRGKRSDCDEAQKSSSTSIGSGNKITTTSGAAAARSGSASVIKSPDHGKSAKTKTNTSFGSNKKEANSSKLASAKTQSQIEDEIALSSNVSSSRLDPSPDNNRLVFGLNPRANKVRYNEFVELRVKQQQQQQQPTITTTTNDVSSTMSQQGNKLPDNNQSRASSIEVKPGTGLKIRASKYGNYYKPQDLVEPKKVLVRQRSKSPDRVKVVNAAINAANSLQPKPQQQKQEKAEAEQMKPNKIKTQEAPKGRKETKSLMAGDNSKTNNSVNQGADQESDRISSLKTKDPQPEDGSSRRSTGSNQQPAVKMQFNIPPPPKLNSGSVSKSSIISYAKSRIYDKQPHFNKHNNNILDSNSNLPESISSGFKPPKQVNVSKAREKWEGGEPFAKCKSRQRFAQASANKKLLYGTWSMTSVVATQQLQFQQALAQTNSNSSSSSRYSATQLPFYPDDTPVKILTRGSVLERVQQYEQAPSSLLKSGSLSSSTASISSSSGDLTDTDSSSGSTKSTSQEIESTPVGEASLTIGSGLSTRSDKQQQQQPTAQLRSPPDISPGALSRRFSFRRRSSATSTTSVIPRFYHPNGKPNTYEMELQKKNIVACFDKFTDRKALLTARAYKRHFNSIALACGFSEYFKEPLYRYIKHQMTDSNLLHSGTINGGAAISATNKKSNGAQMNMKPNLLTRAASIDNSTLEKLQSQNYITCDQFLTCWKRIIGCCFDNPAKFVHLLTLGQRNYLLPDDFVALIQSIIDDHPGLKFLRSAPDFHMRYVQTVIARIYFCINRSWTGKISLNELRKSNLLEVLDRLAKEEDINQISDYFSYEHFYVIYCKFWSLDQDHDLLISKEDLARHNDAAISSRIIDRIFTGVVSKRIQETGKMSYSDFVWFLIAEEDKRHPRSVEYWFRLMDIDGDGFISMYEMEYFYYEQTKRLEMMNIEALPFLDSACQLLDLINPKEKNKISLSDLKRTKLSTIFFDTFINLEKFLEHESREFVSTRDIVQNGVIISDWDRYASEAYEALVTEESSV